MTKCTGVRCPMQYGYKVEECNHTDCPYRTEPITNADKIRAMTDEELVKFIEDTQIAGCPDPARSCRASCKDCIMDWLQQPAEVQ